MKFSERSKGQQIAFVAFVSAVCCILALLTVYSAADAGSYESFASYMFLMISLIAVPAILMLYIIYHIRLRSPDDRKHIRRSRRRCTSDILAIFAVLFVDSCLVRHLPRQNAKE